MNLTVKSELADFMGVTRPTIYKWFSDGALVEPVTPSQLDKIAQDRIVEAAKVLEERQAVAARIRELGPKYGLW